MMHARMAEAVVRSKTTWRSAGLLACCWLAAATGRGAEAVAEPVIDAVHVVPAQMLPGHTDVALGGLSDLFVTATDSEGIVAWSITDRGPNGVAAGPPKRRTLLAADFAPAAIRLRLPSEGSPSVEAVRPLAGVSGKPFSGRPNGVGGDEPILDAATGEAVASDPDGNNQGKLNEK